MGVLLDEVIGHRPWVSSASTSLRHLRPRFQHREVAGKDALECVEMLLGVLPVVGVRDAADEGQAG